MTQNKFIIGITGNSGSGKSTVSKMLAAEGGHTIDADRVAHKVMEPGQPAYKKIVAVFGQSILDNEGQIDRKKLGAIVFNDTQKRTQLESIVHPLVTDEILLEIANTTASFYVVDAVLLVESGLNQHCNSLWLITASEEKRLQRIIARDGLSPEAAQARMKNQRDTTPIAAISQQIINNDGNIINLKTLVQKSIVKVKGSRGEPLAGCGEAPHDFEDIT